MTKLKGLDDFKLAESTVRNRLLVSIDGLTGRGKTHFALTAPGPIILFDLDVRTEGVLHKFVDEKEIYHCKYRLPAKDDQPIDPIEAMKVWNKFKTDFRKALVSGAKSIVIDTGTEAWELIRLARFGKLAQVQPFHYGPVNAEFRGLLRMAMECDNDVNVLIIHKLKPKYVNDKRTDDYERSGFSDMGFLVQAAVNIDYDEEDGPSCTITKCGLDVTMEGFVLNGKLCTFPGLGRLLLPGGDWK